MMHILPIDAFSKIYSLFWDFLAENWENLHIFAIGNGSYIMPQNRPRKIPGYVQGHGEVQTGDS